MDKLVEYLCIIQARLNSSRLPAKIMLDLSGKTLIQRVYETVSKSKFIDKIVVATSNEVSDNLVEMKLKRLNIECFRGDLNNVLKRFYDTSKKYKAKNIIRITADNPLMDAKIIDRLIQDYQKGTSKYCMYNNGIYGLSAEVFSVSALESAYKNALTKHDCEHVTPYIRDNFKTNIIEIDEKYRKPNLSITIDTLDDYMKMQTFYLYCEQNSIEPNIDNFIKLMDTNSEILS